jgi:D-serine deaminase-like pyridoxal phosphate-dependent protein
MLKKAKELGVRIRPHVKTHKTIEGGLLQVGNGELAEGIVVSTLGEARFFAASGKFPDILYGVPICRYVQRQCDKRRTECKPTHAHKKNTSSSKFDAAAELMKLIPRFSVMVDNLKTISKLEQYAKENPHKIAKWSVFLSIDCGYGREGSSPEGFYFIF